MVVERLMTRLAGREGRGAHHGDAEGLNCHQLPATTKHSYTKF